MKINLLNIIRKSIVWNKSLNIWENGEANDYPERTERLRNNSVTATMASRQMQQFCIGKGFGEDLDNTLIGKDRLIDISEDITRDIVNERGVFVLVNYNRNYQIANWKVIPFKKCRIGKKDDLEYSGKILVYNDWCGKVVKEKVKSYDVYNPDKEFINSQVKSAGGWNKYKGQIFYFNMDREYTYPLSRIDSVDLNCNNEFLSVVYTNTLLTDGFFGKTMVVTRPLVDAKIKNPKTDDERRVLREAESERSNFKGNLKQFMGAPNAGGIMHIEVDHAADDLENAIFIKTIESKIEPDLFKAVEDSAMTKILMAFNNIPVALVKSPDSAMLGNSGEALEQAMLIYQKNTSKERDIVERITNEFWKNSKYASKGEKLYIIKLVDEPDPEQVKAKENNNTLTLEFKK